MKLRVTLSPRQRQNNRASNNRLSRNIRRWHPPTTLKYEHRSNTNNQSYLFVLHTCNLCACNVCIAWKDSVLCCFIVLESFTQLKLACLLISMLASTCNASKVALLGQVDAEGQTVILVTLLLPISETSSMQAVIYLSLTAKLWM